jgi:hypothetical protein
MYNLKDNRRFCIFSVEEIDKIDFNQVRESSPESLRISTDGTLTFVKWDGSTPGCVTELETSIGEYSYDEMMEELKTKIWTIHRDEL